MAKDPFNRTPAAPAATNDPFPTTPAAAAPPPAPGVLPKQGPRPLVEVKHFRVVQNPSEKDGCWKPQIRGVVTSLFPGKVLRSTNYDIEELQRQGVQLEECEPRPLAAG